MALAKKDRGVCPIVVGIVWRRLAAKYVNIHSLLKLGDRLSPLQLGVASKRGGEAATHATRRFCSTMPTQRRHYSAI